MHSPPTSLPQRSKLPHGILPWARTDAIFFITICCAPREANQLGHASVAQLIWESIEFRQRRGDWYVYEWLLMPDHLHALISFPPEKDLTKIIANWKEIVAKRTSITWQRDYFDHRLRSHESHEEKSQYIRQNPVRKKLVTRAEDWPFTWAKRGGPSGPALPAEQIL
jgi:putative transposase